MRAVIGFYLFHGDTSDMPRELFRSLFTGKCRITLYILDIMCDVELLRFFG